MCSHSIWVEATAVLSRRAIKKGTKFHHHVHDLQVCWDDQSQYHHLLTSVFVGRRLVQVLLPPHKIFKMVHTHTTTTCSSSYEVWSSGSALWKAPMESSWYIARWIYRLVCLLRNCSRSTKDKDWQICQIDWILFLIYFGDIIVCFLSPYRYVYIYIDICLCVFFFIHSCAYFAESRGVVLVEMGVLGFP